MTNHAERELGEHARLIGQVTIAWNDVHHLVYLTFEQLSGLSEEMAESLFFSLRSDAGQRDLTMAAARVALQADPERLKALTTIINGVGKLAAIRNEAIHTAWAVDFLFSGTGKVKLGGVSKLRKSKANDTEFTARFEKLRGDLLEAYKALHSWRLQKP